VCFEINDVKFAMPRRLIETLSEQPGNQPKGLSALTLSIPIDEFLDFVRQQMPLQLPAGKRAKNLYVWIAVDVQSIHDRQRGFLGGWPPYQLSQGRTDVPNTIMYERDAPIEWASFAQLFIPLDAPPDIFYECYKWRRPINATLPFADDDPTCQAHTIFDLTNPMRHLRLDYSIYRSKLEDRISWDKAIRLFLNNFVVKSKA
jgi:hypothetical protein